MDIDPTAPTWLAPARGWPYPRPSRAALLDGEATSSLREALGALLGHCHRASIAVSRIRLAAVDLAPADVGTVTACRVLVGRLDAEAAALPRTPDAREGARVTLSLLEDFIRSGRVEVRSAGVDGWYPDFSVYEGLRMGPSEAPVTAVLLGAHVFARHSGAAGHLTSLVVDPAAGERAATRFERLWGAGYDVLPVVSDMLASLRRTLEPVRV